MKGTFGAGCFWCVKHAFRKMQGITSTAVGYMGGATKNPTYEDVCTDMTGHSEVVQVEYDPSKILYREILNVFWGNHDPTTLNRQVQTLEHNTDRSSFSTVQIKKKKR